MRQIAAAASDANVGRRISSVNHRVAAPFTASVEMNRTCAPTAFAALTTCRVASTIDSQSFAYAAWTTSVGSTFAKAAATPVGSRRSAATQATPATARRWVNATTHSRRLSECSSQRPSKPEAPLSRTGPLPTGRPYYRMHARSEVRNNRGGTTDHDRGSMTGRAANMARFDEPKYMSSGSPSRTTMR